MGIIDSFRNAWQAAAQRNAARRATAKPVIPPGGFGANLNLGEGLKNTVQGFMSSASQLRSMASAPAPVSLPQPGSTPPAPARAPISRPPVVAAGAPAPASTPAAPTPAQATAMQLLQNPRYAGVLQRPDGDPLKAEFFAELAKQMPGATPAGTADPAFAGVQAAAVDPLQTSLQDQLTKATGAYNEYEQDAATFATDFRKGLKGKGYDLDAGLNAINVKRSELMKAMSSGTLETRNFEKVGRIAAEMADLIGDQQKMERQVKEETDTAVSFFERSGIMKKQEADKARDALNSYFESREAQFKQELDIAQLVGFFRGQPTLAQKKYELDVAQESRMRSQGGDGSGMPGMTKRQTAFLTDASSWIGKLGGFTADWGTAWNAMRAKYPEATNEEIDQALNKNEYYPK